jgi:IPT/TIG domain
MRTRILVAALAALVGCGSNGNNVTCGDGTTLVDGVCELGSGGSGSGGGGGDTCGSGTTLQGTTCVANGGGDASAPTVTKITPGEAGVMGGGPFLIDGTGFAGDNVTSLDVYFGDTTNTNCEATVVLATATEISGVVPAFCDLNVTVSVTTNLGSASTAFHYDAIFGADGNEWSNIGFSQGLGGFGGELWVIDPFSTTAYDFGPIEDANGVDYPIGGIAFDATGTLWAVTTGNGVDGDVDGFSQLVTIDPTTPDVSTVTIVGDTVDANGDGYWIRDLKLIGGTLYGWGYDVSGDGTQSLVSIDTTTGAVTALGTPTAISNALPSAGIAYDGTTTWVAANFAGSDSTDGGTGELDSADVTTGVLTANANPLDWPFGAPVNTMDVLTIDGTANILAVIDNGTYGALATLESESGGLAANFGETLALVDPTDANGEVLSPVFEMPAQPTLQSAVGAIAIPAATTQTLQVVRKGIDASKWQTLSAATKPAHPATHAANKLASFNRRR